MTAARRHPVTLAATRRVLRRAGFAQHVWPAEPGHANQTIFTWTDRHHLIKVVLGPDRGHQTVIVGHHDGQRWHADTEQRHTDHVAAVRAALAQWHRFCPRHGQAAA